MRLQLVTPVVVFAFLSGCGGLNSTIPSPVTEVAKDAFQMRLHATGAEGTGQVNTGLLAAPYLSTKGGLQGVGQGCILTTLGKAPARVKANLKSGDCKAELCGGESCDQRSDE